MRLADKNRSGNVYYEEFIGLFEHLELKKKSEYAGQQITEEELNLIAEEVIDKINISDSLDLFMGKKTILNTPLACVKRCYQLIAEMK